MSRSAGAGKLFQIKKSPFWYFYCRNRQVSTREKKKTDAERFRRRYMAERDVEPSSERGPENVTISELLNDVEQRYLDERRASISALRSRLKHLRPFFGDLRAAEYETRQRDRYVAGPARRERYEGFVIESTIYAPASVLESLSRALEVAAGFTSRFGAAAWSAYGGTRVVTIPDGARGDKVMTPLSSAARHPQALSKETRR